MSVMQNIKDFLFVKEEDELELDEEEYTRLTKYEKKSGPLPDKDIQMVLFEPRTYSEGQVAGSHLKDGRACVVNLHKLNDLSGQREIDFLAGVVFALGGTIQKIGPNIILCTPSGIGVSGEINLEDKK